MIQVEHLTKCYGDFMAVDDLSFTIEEGQVYGFLGPNGAGKSTTMNIMTGCLSATDGRVTIDGYDIFEEPDKAKRKIGYLPELPPLYMNETPAEYLKFVGEVKGLKGKALQEQIEEVIEQVKIGHVRNKLISTLSKGYRQRVGIAQALLGRPEVIILDEPTVGLDPIQIIEIRDLIKQLGESHTVILSSHILSEVQAICKKVLIINKGKLVAFDTPENLEHLMLGENGVTFTVEASKEAVEEVLTQLPDVTDFDMTGVDDSVTIVKLQTRADDLKDLCRTLFFAFAERKEAILEMTSKKASLEDVFIELTGGEKNAETDMPSLPPSDADTGGIQADASDMQTEPTPVPEQTEAVSYEPQDPQAANAGEMEPEKEGM